MAALHKKFCGLAGPTDVLTFQHGEIVISAESAARQAKVFRSTLAGEIRLYLLHGLLHLAGFNDVTPRQRKQMLQLQKKLFFSLCQVERG
jgi:probable rRNA maturation factor